LSYPDFFHFPGLFPDHFGIPCLFQVSGHPAPLPLPPLSLHSPFPLEVPYIPARGPGEAARWIWDRIPAEIDFGAL